MGFDSEDNEDVEQVFVFAVIDIINDISDLQIDDVSFWSRPDPPRRQCWTPREKPTPAGIRNPSAPLSLDFLRKHPTNRDRAYSPDRDTHSRQSEPVRRQVRFSTPDSTVHLW